ncbi:DNA ligase 1 isoform X1 [Eutrema salsugineum]|uniref:DNA ligase 1 isoform X1 n=1 Tax=Eutrema salsugineum TaxID=72664 RepID=UPI000CED6742|nr:DNA ligase 1 isoform X1 [Eutrema salsugineum]
MATTSSTPKAKSDNQNLTRTRSLGRKPKLPSSVSSEDGSDQKPEKPLPNYLKPTISSRPDPVKFLKKNNNSLEDNQKLLRRRSFDRPPPSLTSPSTSSSRIQKSLNVSPSRPRDRPMVPREKPVTALRSSSFHGSRGVPRGGTSVKSPPVAPKKSGLSSNSTSLKSKKESSENVTAKKASEKEIFLDTASMSSAHEDEEEIVKVEADVQVSDDIEKPKDEKENKEVQVEVVHVDESGDENERGGPTTVAPPVREDIVVAKENEKEEEEEERLINIEDKNEGKLEEIKEQKNNQENKGELEEGVKKEIDDFETSEKVDTNSKEVESVEETTEEKEEEVNEEREVKEEEKEKVKEEQKEKVKEEFKEKVKEEESGEGKKKEVVKGKTECSSAYNDVIASKMQENPRKNKVLALAGAFQTVIDYETAASK